MEELNKSKKHRSIIRTQFIKCLKIFEEIASQGGDDNAAQAKFELMTDHMSRMEELDNRIFELLLQSDSEEEVLTAEMDRAETYKEQYLKAKASFEQLKADRQNESVHSCNTVKGICSPKISWPKVELPKFDGEYKNWLGFWGQFRKIHVDPNLSQEDKFQYLRQCMIQGSRPYELINSYPPTGENYEKAIESLTNRFGKRTILVEVYIRELLQLVLSRMAKSSENFQVAELYDTLESHLRALESLDIRKESCAPLLFPLVESSLPEPLLRAWQRNSGGAGAEPEERLSSLLNFLQKESDNEARIAMAFKGFSLNKKDSKQSVETKKKDSQKEPIPTAANLVDKTNSLCLFCDGDHQSGECPKIDEISMKERCKILKNKKACTRCLKVGHSSFRCWCKIKCKRCDKRHHTIMCFSATPSTSGTQTTQSTNVKQTFSGITVSNDVYLQTLRVKLHLQHETIILRALCDTGSQHSYILKDLVTNTDLQPKRNFLLKHNLFGGINSLPIEHSKYDIKISGLTSNVIYDFEVLDQNIICANVPTISQCSYVEKLQRKNIFISDTGKEEPISLLIGADMIPKIMTGNFIKLDENVAAIETRLGWTLIGKACTSKQESDTFLSVISLFVNEENVSDLWKLDTLGIMDPIEKKLEDCHVQHVKDVFKETTIIQDGRYEVLLPWKENHPPLLNNKNLCLKRLEKVTDKLHQEGFFEAYNQVFYDWLREGIIEKISHCEYDINAYYLPHRHVVRLSSATTPIRPVFDASAHSKGSPSLNQCLETGPNLIELIPDLLLRFREKKIGVISDIRKAFLMININPKDRDVLRFLWWDLDNPKKLQIYRHCRVVFGLTCSPFLLGATIELHLENVLKNSTCPNEVSTITVLQKSFYVDNCVTSVESKEELEQFRELSIQTMASGGFDLRCWEYSGDGTLPCQSSVLGVRWDKSQDTLALKEVPSINLSERVTKRVVLSASHKIFDCLGVVCPVLLLPKLLLRNLDKAKGWDDELDECDKSTFLNWFNNLPVLKEINIPRWLFNEGYQKDTVSFHVFVDASKDAYSSVIFVRFLTANGPKVKFVQAKSRVAPTSKSTIPRLELLAATVGARLFNSTIKALGYENYSVYYWSDSSTVISWIKRNWEWGVFVWNRVQEIRKLSDPSRWFFVPGNMNPADLPSRGCDARILLDSKWWEGPHWLKLEPEFWPKQEFGIDESEVNKEKKKHCSQDMAALLSVSDTNQSYWYTRYFSNYNRIVRLIGWIFRFISNCQNQSRRTRSSISGDLNAEEYKKAESKLLLLVQRDSFVENDSKLVSLSTFKDEDGLVRVKTPIAEKKDFYCFRYPIVLDPNNILVVRLIEFEHKRNLHAGVGMLLSILREKYWILRGRRSVRKVVKSCVICQRYSSKCLQEVTPPLPENRVNVANVFEVVGVDFAGPLFLKDKSKVWICLFTCAVYRAVHLELASSLSVDAFLLVFRRFVARRGVPSVVYSDNGTNFVSASKVLNITWLFNPPSAPWWGGFFERLIRVVKDILRKVLKNSCLDYESLSTLLFECESVVNSRPITYASENPSDLVALTPNNFLRFMGQSRDSLDINCQNLRKNFKHVFNVAHALKKRFRDEYLGTLKNNKVERRNDSNRNPIKVNDIVLIGNDQDKRLVWPLARVVELVRGRDGRVRVVKLVTGTGAQLVRPLQRVYPLETASGGRM